MKKVLSLVLALAMLFTGSLALAGELALVTDIGTIDDKSFNQGSWEGLAWYAEENDISHEYYRPMDASADAYLDSIQLAVESGAKLVVTPGFLFEGAIFMAQEMYPETMFVLVDGVPNDGETRLVGDNTVSVLYAEEQSGFLAGYAAVKEGYTSLGFIGGIAVPAVVRFGVGFVEGADYAAQEMGLEPGAVTVNFSYSGVFWPTPEVQAMAASWYNDGVEAIFVAAGGATSSVTAAAEAAEDKWVIGVDSDQSEMSPTILTSALKTLQTSVYMAIAAMYDGEFPGGEIWVMGADNDGVGLPMETSRFATFNQADYDAVYAKLVSGEIEVVTDDDLEDGSTPDFPCEVVIYTVFQ
ncbi:MAG: BMP family ABC transporter substrate-binding protein [Clostridia bacterium]|nr:BMP family ABC transporter substrate-binding protein [Clostridia bacterium]